MNRREIESPSDAGISNRGARGDAFGKTAYADFASARYVRWNIIFMQMQ